MDIRLCHPSDFSDFLKLKNAHTCEFEGVFAPLINSVMLPFLHNFNLTGIIHRGHGLGELINENGSYDGCLGRLQRNESDVLLRFADYPSPASNISQGDIFLDTRLTLAQHYSFSGARKKFQILSVISSLYQVMPFICLYLISVLLVIKTAHVLMRTDDYPKVYIIFGRLMEMRPVTHHNSFYAFAHAFRFGLIRAKQYHSRLIFLTLSIYSLIIVHVLCSSIKTELVVVPDPDHWENYDQIIIDQVRPVFIDEMDTIQHFKSSPVGSVERTLWQYISKNFHKSDITIPADVQSFLSSGLEMEARKMVLIVDDIMARVVQNAACSINKYDFSGLLRTWKGDSVKLMDSVHFYITSDPLSKMIKKGVVYSDFFQSKAAQAFKQFSKYSHESGLTQRNIKVVTTVNIVQSFVSMLPRSNKDLGMIDECRSDSIVKPKGDKNKLVTLGNTASLRTCYLALNGFALVVLLLEKAYMRISKSEQVHMRSRLMRMRLTSNR